MYNNNSTSPFPFQISELPKGVTAYPDGRIMAEENASGTIALRLDGETEEKKINLKIVADKNSDLKIIFLQNISTQSELSIDINCEADKSAKLHFIQFNFGGSKVHTNLTQQTKGENAEINADLLSFTKGSQEHSFDFTNIFDTQNGKGQILMKGVAIDEGHLNMIGSICITKNGTGADSFLKQDSLFLSKKARISSSPRLEIGTNDVKAGHGASVTNLNDENLMYLTSRGISPSEAKNMMIKGFLTEILDKISDLPELQEEIMQTI